VQVVICEQAAFATQLITMGMPSSNPYLDVSVNNALLMEGQQSFKEGFQDMFSCLIFIHACIRKTLPQIRVEITLPVVTVVRSAVIMKFFRTKHSTWIINTFAQKSHLAFIMCKGLLALQ
jgi:hypothetical protein